MDLVSSFVWPKACRPGATEEVWTHIVHYANKQLKDFGDLKVKSHADSKVLKEMTDVAAHLEAVMKIGHPKHGSTIGMIVQALHDLARVFSLGLQELELKTALAGQWCVCCWVVVV